MQILTSRVVGLEKAGALVDEKLSATARLACVQQVIDEELRWATEEARREGADRAALQDVMLIDDLERVVPAATGPVSDVLPSIEGVQLLVSAILWGNDEERARVERDPRVQAVLAYHERLAARLKPRDDAHGPSGDGTSR